MNVSGGRKRGEDVATWLVFLGTAVALALRLYRLTFQAMWWDEGISLYLSGQGLDALVFDKDFALDLHPPLYHVLLAGWTSLVGADVFSARAFSAFLGALNVPLLFVVIRRLGGAVAGVSAAWLLALSPVHIFYSQEIRMYSLVPLLATMSILAFIWLVEARNKTEERRGAIAYAASTAAGLWAYYYIGLLVVAQNVFFAVRWLRRRERLLTWILAQSLTAVLFAAWAAVLIWMLLSTDYWVVSEGAQSAPELWPFFRTFAQTYTVGFSVVEPWSYVFAVLFLAVSVVGLASTISRRAWPAGVLVILWLAVPVLLAYAIATQRAFVFPRFVLFSALALYGLAGFGVAWLWGRSRPLALVVVVLLFAASLPSLSRHYTSPRTAYSSSDYLVSLGEVASLGKPSDLFVSDQAWGAGYARGYLPEPAPGIYWASPGWEQDGDVIARSLAEHGRVWVLSWQNGERAEVSSFEESLAKQGTPLFLDQFGEFRLRLVGKLGEERVESPLGRSRSDKLGNQIELVAYNRRADARLSPGGHVDLTLVWRCLSVVDKDYKVFVQLVGPDGNLYGQKDNPPVAGNHPTTAWKSGELILDRYRFTIAPTAPAGEYRLIAGMYDPVSGTRLPTGEGDHILLENFAVAR